MKLNLQKGKYILLLLTAAIIWGGGYIATAIALQANVQPFFMTTTRFALAGIVLLIYTRKTFFKTSKATIYRGMILGIFLFLGFAFQTIGLKYTTVSRNAFLTAVFVVMVPFLYWVIYRKRPVILQFFAAFLTLIGVRLINYNITGDTSIGDFLTLIGAFFFSIHIILLGIYTKHHNPVILTGLQCLNGSFLSFIFMCSLESIPVLNVTGVLMIIYLGIFSSCIGFVLQSISQKHLSQITTSIVLSTESIFGTLFSILFLKEIIGINLIIGGAIMFIAILLSEINITPKTKSIPSIPKISLLNEEELHTNNDASTQ